MIKFHRTENQSWAAPKKCADINWADLKTDPPPIGSKILLFGPFIFNNFRIIESFDPDDGIIRFAAAYSLLKSPFEIKEKEG